MPTKSLKDASRENWICASDEPKLNEIQLGAILRIADAVEKLGDRYEKLENANKSLQRSLDFYRTEWHAQTRKVTTLKGVITKLKNKIANETNPGDNGL